MKLRPYLKSASCNLALVAASCAVSLAIVEAALRRLEIGSDQLLRPDPIVGVRYIPGGRGLVQGACFKTRVAINSHGWRSPETSWHKPDGVFRILLLGDSFMAALQVDHEQTFAARLENELNRAGLPKKIEIINLGVPSFGTAQEYLALRHFGKEYAPDWVLLAFLAQNDVLNNSSVLERPYNRSPRPYFDVADGELVELPFEDTTPGWVRGLRAAVRPLRAYPFLRDRLLRLPLTHRVLYTLGITDVVPRERGDGDPASRAPRLLSTQLLVYQREYRPQWHRAWAITRKLLLRIRDEVEQMGAGLTVFAIGDPVAVMPSRNDAAEHAVLDFDKPARLLEELIGELRIDYFSLLPAFRGAIGDSKQAYERLYLPCDGHWTAAGNRFAATIAAEHLRPVVHSLLRSRS